MKFAKVPLSRLVLRVIASAFGAGAIAFSTTVSAALINTTELRKGTGWIILAAVLGAIGKDVQASLSRSPSQGDGQ